MPGRTMDRAPQLASADRPLAVNRFAHQYRQTPSEKILGVRVEVKRSDIHRRRLFNGAFLAWRKLRLELIGDGFCDLTLDGKNVGQIAIVSLRPEMRIGARIDQLGVYSHAIANALNTSFQDMRNSKFISNLP